MAQNYGVDIQRWNGQDYDTILPTPDAHASTHQANGSDPLILQTGNYGDKTVTSDKLGDSAVVTSKIANNAVTRAKMANDALYSPYIAKETSNIAASDIGGTIQNSWNQSATYTLEQALSKTLPVGSTFAVLRSGSWTANFDVKIECSGIRIGIQGDKYYTGNKIIRVLDFMGMVALRKVAGDNTNGDLWVAIGNVEVVS